MKQIKLTYANLHEYTQNEIRSGHRLGADKESNRQLENAVRKHLDGANTKERRDFYQQFYARKK